MLFRTYVVLDVETTGLDPRQDKIIEIAAVRFQDGSIVDTFNTLINPEQPIPKAIQDLTGIDDSMVEKAPRIDAVLPELLAFSKDSVLVAHNIKFDLAFLNQAGAFKQWPQQFLLDTLALSRIIFPCLTSYRLIHLSKDLAIELAQHHRALDDALATVELLKALWQATLALEKTLVIKMIKLAPRSLRPWFEAALSADTGPSVTADTITTGLFAKKETYTAPSPVLSDFCLDEIAALLEPDGLLAGKLSEYEHRPQQTAMLKIVAEALSNGQHLAVEAGTGIGKSLAYLLPAIYWACYRGEKVAIATHTINLQEQLMYKDLPQLQEILPFPVEIALVKGRSNYLCRRKLEEFLNDPRAGEEERFFGLRLMHWLEVTTSGDWNELRFTPEEINFKIFLSAHKESCIGNVCPYNERCFVFAARLKAEAANIIILNHSLLLSDIKMNNNLLPSYPYLIIDEAHHLEEAATEHLGITISQNICNSYYRRLGSRDTKFSFLGRLGKQLQHIRPEPNKELLDLMEELDRSAVKTQQTWQFFWNSLAELNNPTGEKQSYYSIRFTEHLKETPIWDRTIAIFGELEAGLTTLAVCLSRLQELLTGIVAEEITAEAGKLSSVFKQHISELDQILEADPAVNISWLDSIYDGQLILRSAPLKTGPLLAEQLFTPKQAVILTSATLTVNNSFAYFKDQVGLNILPAEQQLSCQVDSPFDYQSQALLCAVKGLSNPSHLSDGEYARAIAPVLTDILTGVDGQILVLCTSHRFLRAIYEVLNNNVENNNYTFLAQGIDGNRSQLLESFRRTPRAVLIGTSSFWEGIDLPGELLRCVVIPRLPFPSPGIPVLAARMEHMSAEGGNPFISLSLPQAVIRFRQGFGRLIRRKDDRGALVVLDQRLLSKKYGRYFSQSLPKVTKIQLSPEKLSTSLQNWFKTPSSNQGALSMPPSNTIIKEDAPE